MTTPLRVCWIVPDDHGGGVVSVAEACCRQASARGMAATLLLLHRPTGHVAEYASFAIDSLNAAPPFAEAPRQLLAWLRDHPQDVVLFNACGEVDDVPPFIPQDVRSVYCIHDTARRYCAPAIRHQDSLDAIVAVSEAVGRLVRPHVARPERMRVLHNGTILPIPIAEVLGAVRSDDIVFMGGGNPSKGSYDALKLWSALQRDGFSGRLHWFDAMDRAFAAEIARAPGAERIVLHGRRPRSEIFATAQACKVMLMLSRAESFGMVTIEAMGMGCLPVAWDIETGTAEVVAPAFRHFAPLGDFAALARCVTAAIDAHPALYEASTRDVRERFSEDAMGERYATLIADLMTRAPVTRPQAGAMPPPFAPPRRYFQYLPPSLRDVVRRVAGRWPALGYAVRNLRGL